MLLTAGEYALFVVAAAPFVYYLLAIYSSARFFSTEFRQHAPNPDYFPPISCLKPVRGLDPDAYENFASFCRQDYPHYEVVFCVDANDPALPVIQSLIRDFPQRQIRILYGSGRTAVNDKVSRLVRLTAEARHELLVISDGDTRVAPGYLRTVAGAFLDPKVGGATCLYVSPKETSLVQQLQSTGMISDFFASTLVAWQLDGIKFMLGQTMAARKKLIAGFGGFERLEDRPADDLWLGRLIAEQGYEVKLLPQLVYAVADFQSFRDLLYKRVRWMTVMRMMRPWGHFGLLFTWGLIWALIAVAAHQSVSVLAAYLGIYLLLRIIMVWLIGIHGMRQKGMWKKIVLIPVWDALAFGIWLASFTRNTIRWRGIDYRLQQGMLVAATRKKSDTPRPDSRPRLVHGVDENPSA
jgi:ceramide glucosyltransferase